MPDAGCSAARRPWEGKMVDVLTYGLLLIVLVAAAAFLIYHFFPTAFPASFPAFWRAP